MTSNRTILKRCRQKCHRIFQHLRSKENDMRITQRSVLERFNLYEEKSPVHIGDLKGAFRIVEKRDIVKTVRMEKDG